MDKIETEDFVQKDALRNILTAQLSELDRNFKLLVGTLTLEELRSAASLAGQMQLRGDLGLQLKNGISVLDAQANIMRVALLSVLAPEV